ncbi:MAG: GxxExxY protein [Candidatus Marinimicrobia bacterium]|jgi:GxxExxY protein|nr:GxxExxY protein [Candidatus Neomarinimicrobiota bacterium]MBT6937226.1 GxxExxY protein [Candidatus Neomarinimicrobiota bacterium]
MNTIYLKELSDKIIGSTIEVHKTLGNGFLEKVYENALIYELSNNGIKVESQVPVPVRYKGNTVGDYFCDVLVEEKIILELKVAKNIDPIHEAQLLHYLKATELKVGYIINFGNSGKLQFKRLVN